MTERSTFDRLRTILCEYLGLRTTDIDQHSKFREDLGVDSLDEVELIMAAEEEFGLDFYDDDEEKMDKCLTVQEMVGFIDSKLAN